MIFKAHFDNPDLTADDAAVLTPPVERWQCLPMDLSYHRHSIREEISESFPSAVRSMIFPVWEQNHLYLTCAFVIEEGFPMEKLEEIAEAMEKTAKEAGVRIVSGIPRLPERARWTESLSRQQVSVRSRMELKLRGNLAKPGDAGSL